MGDFDENLLNKHESQKLLKELCSDKEVIKKIETLLSEWPFSSLTELQGIRQDLKQVVLEIKKRYFHKEVEFRIFCAIHNIVFCSLSDSLISIVREKFKEEDLNFHEKCRELSGCSIGNGITDKFCVLPYTAAIVELSLLDTHESPLEKMNCLCTTFDMVYAEIKLHLISIISKYSEKEIEIPIFSNDEFLSVLELVIIRSKLLYFSSNLFFIEYFSEDILQQNLFKRNILDTFIQAYQRIQQLDWKFQEPNLKMSPSLSVTEAIHALMNLEYPPGHNSNVFEEYREQYSTQIMKSTEANFIP